MELSEWCEQVPHGQYFQPIRLRLDVAHEKQQVDPSTAQPPAPSVSPTEPPAVPTTPPPNAAATGANVVDDSNGVMASPGLSTPKRLKRRQKPPPTPPRTPKPVSDVDRDSTLLLPPFQSANVGVDRMVLNVGGPVWAMDWLPHDVYRATTNACAKHNKSVNGNKENASSANGAGSSSSTSKDPLAGWRLLALSTHPPCTVLDDKLVKSTPPDHYYDAPQGGRSLIQIWAIPVTKPTAPKGDIDEQQHDQEKLAPRMIPRLVYAIDHESGVAWDLQWSPLTHKMPRHRDSEGLLGVLAVAFGDGSLQIFEVPIVSADKLQAQPRELMVDRLQPIGSGKIDKTIQLSARWSPHRWNLLLTGSSDGSVALWNLEELLSKPVNDNNEEPYELEPQRRFQDADTIGKQEIFDWGWGWVAIRAVCWSPFDENLFCTTGNDSLFKIWDIRESRICFRSHRIRSTWGLAIQWIDDTSIQISGDQGSLFMYDLLSGSYQKLHFHPQIDSPVWDLQFARRGRVPLLASSCTSGSLRLAPAKKLFRAPQHSVEICRLQGEKVSNVEQPYKTLSLSFEHRIVSGSAEAASPATREFCERDAALHRVRLSTQEPGEFPCFLSTAGHAGLVVIMEMQDELDHLFENFFMQPSKKIGRPRKTTEATASAWNARQPDQAKGKKVVPPPKIKRVSGVKLSNFVHANAGGGISGIKPRPKKVSQATEFPEFEMESAASASASEQEYQEGEESESDSDELSLVDDNSDEDRIMGSDGEDSDGVEIVESPEARMRQDYQMDLSEEDAILLAIQMSELEQTTPSTPPVATGPGESKPAATSKIKKKPHSRKENGSGKKTPASTSIENTMPSAGFTKKQKMHASASIVGTTDKSDAAAATPVQTTIDKSTKKKSVKKPEEKGSAFKLTTPKKKPTGTSSVTPSQQQPDVNYVEELDQASIQMMIYQQNMSEEDALREAIRMSEMGHMRRSGRKRKAPPTPSSPEILSHSEATSAQRTPKSHKRVTPLSHKTEPTLAALSPDEVSRRLEFATTSPQQSQSIASLRDGSSTLASTSEPKTTPPLAPKRPPKPPSAAKKRPALKAATSEAPSTPAVGSVESDGQSTMGASEAVPSTPVHSAKKSVKSVKKTPSAAASKKAKAKRATSADTLTEEELLAIALQTSQIEF